MPKYNYPCPCCPYDKTPAICNRGSRGCVYWRRWFKYEWRRTTARLRQPIKAKKRPRQSFKYYSSTEQALRREKYGKE